jgi:5-methyltetrahydropteroyltriglutamate--homocysteine methyltransferase
MSTDRHRILTTVVGSYPAPGWLVQCPSEQALVDATRVVLATQERTGIDLVCDGELYRFDPDHLETNGMIEYFVRRMSGIRNEIGFEALMAYRDRPGMRFRRRPPGVVAEPIGHGTLDLPGACRRAMALAAGPLKFTITGPHMLAKTLIDEHYGRVEDVAFALADVLAAQVRHLDASVVQLDEANLPGHPGEWRWASEAINRVLAEVRGAPAVHLCFGNYGGQRVQRGGWDALVSYLNSLRVDHIVMECRNRPSGELEVFRDLDSAIGFGLGVVDIKSTEVESADAVAAQIERAAWVLGEGRVRYVHPDCGFWMLPRSVADAKMRALVLGRDLFEGKAATL